MGKQYFIKIGEFNRVRVELVILKGKVKDLMIQLETFVRGKWREIARYNYSHGFPHRDLIFQNGRRIKEKISETNLSKVVNLAINDFKENWEKYLRRCGYEENRE